MSETIATVFDMVFAKKAFPDPKIGSAWAPMSWTPYDTSIEHVCCAVFKVKRVISYYLSPEDDNDAEVETIASSKMHACGRFSRLTAKIAPTTDGFFKSGAIFTHIAFPFTQHNFPIIFEWPTQSAKVYALS